MSAPNSSTTVLFLAGREPGYVRNAMLLQCLERNRVALIDCSDSSATYPARFLRVIRSFLARRREPHDAVLLGFLGQPLVPLVRPFVDAPLILDAFVSVWDTLCFDRQRFSPRSLPGRFCHWLDRYACERAGLILADTEAHISYFSRTFGISGDKFKRIFVGADERLFFPRPAERPDDTFRVFYYSSFLPLHGCEHIVQAAALLKREKGIEFTLVGNGPERGRVVRMARQMGLDNLRFLDWLPYEQLPREIARADLCLGGHFSGSDKARRVIAGKTFQFLAMEKPVIVGEGEGNHELLTDRHDALFVRPADPEGLSRAILEVQGDPALRASLAAQGYRTFRERCSLAVLSREMSEILDAARQGR